MIDSMIDETLFVVKNLDKNLKEVAEKQKKLDEKMDFLEFNKTKIRKKLFPLADI
jgi:hypothetical protein